MQPYAHFTSLYADLTSLYADLSYWNWDRKSLSAPVTALLKYASIKTADISVMCLHSIFALSRFDQFKDFKQENTPLLNTTDLNFQ